MTQATAKSGKITKLNRVERNAWTKRRLFDAATRMAQQMSNQGINVLSPFVFRSSKKISTAMMVGANAAQVQDDMVICVMGFRPKMVTVEEYQSLQAQAAAARQKAAEGSESKGEIKV